MNSNHEIIEVPQGLPRSVPVDIFTSPTVEGQNYFFEVGEKCGVLGVSLGWTNEWNPCLAPRLLIFPLRDRNEIEVWTTGGSLWPNARLIGQQAMFDPEYTKVFGAPDNGHLVSPDTAGSRLAVVKSGLILHYLDDKIWVSIQHLEGKAVAWVLRPNGPWWPPDNLPEMLAKIVGEPPNYSLQVTAGTSQDQRYFDLGTMPLAAPAEPEAD